MTQMPMAKFHSNEHEEYPFKGDISTVEIEDIDEDGNYDTSLLNGENQIMFYDNKKLKNRQVFGKGAEPNSLRTEEIFDYVYKNGKIDSVYNYSVKKDSSIHLKTTWVYYEIGDSIQIKKTVNSRSSKTTKLFRSNNVIRYYNFESNDSTLTKEVFIDSKKRPVRYVNYRKNGELKNIFISNYLKISDKSPSISYAIDYNKNEVLRYEYVYNKFGDRIGSKSYDKSGKLKRETESEYVYDSHGNWIQRKKIITLEKHDIKNTVFLKRKITYN